MKKYVIMILLFGVLVISGSARAAMHAMGEDSSDQKIERQMQPAWRSCAQSSDCELIEYGCNGMMAANKRYGSEASEVAHTIGGNPANLSCAMHSRPHYVASCMNNLCYATNPTE